jgi:hypothetical protein
VAELQAAATRAIFVGSASQRAVFILLPKLEVLGPSVGVFAYFVIVSNYRPFFATRAFPSVSLFPGACWHLLASSIQALPPTTDVSESSIISLASSHAPDWVRQPFPGFQGCGSRGRSYLSRAND